MKEELLKGLTEEQIAKVKACKNQEELFALAKQEGIELTDEQLEAVSGGCGTSTTSKIRQRGGVCPYCHSKFVTSCFTDHGMYYYCETCEKTFNQPFRG